MIGDGVEATALVALERAAHDQLGDLEEVAEFEQARQRMECPSPRVQLCLALRGIASSAINNALTGIPMRHDNSPRCRRSPAATSSGVDMVLVLGARSASRVLPDRSDQSRPPWIS